MFQVPSYDPITYVIDHENFDDIVADDQLIHVLIPLQSIENVVCTDQSHNENNPTISQVSLATDVNATSQMNPATHQVNPAMPMPQSSCKRTSQDSISSVANKRVKTNNGATAKKKKIPGTTNQTNNRATAKPKKKTPPDAINWTPYTKPRKNRFYKFEYDGPNGPNVPDNLENPIDFYLLFLTDELLHKMAEETNRYAEQKIIDKIVDESLTANSRLQDWKAVDVSELKIFFAYILWFGLDQKPSVAKYWSQNILYKNEITSSHGGMTRNRFELILSNIHICDNKTSNTSNKMYKIQYLIDYLNTKFLEMYTPGRNVCIDETMMAWRGRLSFRQYIPSKRHKYGIKFFKLCLPHGYTHKFSIYSGKMGDSLETQSLSERVVLELCDDILNSNRTLYTDNFYTSVTLAKRLLLQKTHLVGTLRANRKLNPPDLAAINLQRGEMITYAYDGIAVSKWKDKRDVTFLTTKHRPIFVQVKSKRGSKFNMKPQAIVDYNSAKTFIDISDQKKAYSDPCRRGVKWYRKVMVELLCNTAVINAYILYLAKSNKKITVTEFRESITTALFSFRNENRPATPISPRSNHGISSKKERGRCVLCYRRVADSKNRKEAMKLSFIYTFCSGCPEKFMCFECFNRRHVIKTR